MFLRALLFASFSLLILPVSTALAGEPPVPIEGKLLVTGYDIEGGSGYAYFMHGTSDSTTPYPGPPVQHMVISPLCDKVAYQVHVAAPESCSVWTAALDGTGKVNLTEIAGMVGINCFPDWSPDASQIVFQHSDPAEGQQPCEAGFRLWIMDSDGQNAHEVAPHVSSSMFQASWAPSASRLLCRMYEGGDINTGGAITIGTDGSDILQVPNNVGVGEDWSPDGSLLAGSADVLGVVDGEVGTWRQLRVTNVDGSNPRALVQQFISNADIERHIDLRGGDSPALFAGPVFPKWSPKGDRIAFLAALPFDSEGPRYEEQVEIWVYDLSTQDLTKITNDLCFDAWLSWNGPNTLPDDPEVTVDNVTVTFSEVRGEGVTTILRDRDPPGVPTGFFFDYDFHELATTAEITGPVTICMTYTDQEVPPAAEADLAILRWDGAQWIDITTSRDPVNNIICAQTDTLSPIALYGIRKTKFPDVPAWGFGTDGLDPHWAYYQVMACVEARIVSGYDDGYHPEWAVTRDQMAVYISRSVCAPTGEAGLAGYIPPATPSFSDVGTGYWAYKYIEYAVEANIVGGYEDGTYRSEYVLDRGQMAVFIAHALVTPAGDAGIPDAVGDPTFPDVPNTGYGPDGADPFWAYKHIEYIAGEGVCGGYYDKCYHPEYTCTRDQMAVYIARAFGLGG